MTSRLCPTAPRNFGKRGEGGLWGCSCDSLCLCVPLHPPEALQDPAVPPGPPARGSVCVGCLAQRTLLARQSGGRSSTEVLGRRPPGGLMAKRSQSPGGRAELDVLLCPRCPRPGDEFAVLALVCPLQTENKQTKKWFKSPFFYEMSARSTRGGEGCAGRGLQTPRAESSTDGFCFKHCGKMPRAFPCFISPFPPSFFNERKKPQTPPG